MVLVVSQATQTLFTQSGVFGLAQSLSLLHATQRPVAASHTVPGRFAQ